MNPNPQNLGMQFIWWCGVIEDRNDPKKAGRCKVRIIGAHTPNKSDLPTSDLPWAQPMIATNENTNVLLKEGDYVVGFYFDGPDCQVPIIMGLLPGVPSEQRSTAAGFSDPRSGSELAGAPAPPASLSISNGPVSITKGTAKRNPKRLNESSFSRIATGEKTSQTPIQFKKTTVTRNVAKAGGGNWTEPTTPYATKYPYNRVIETESGHIMEFDDTPGAERVHIYHRSGTSIEIHPNGTIVTRVHASDYEVVLGEKNIYIKGDVSITSAGNLNLKAQKNVNIEAGQAVNIIATTELKTDALKQSHFAKGPMDITGIPMNLNGPGAAAGQPALPVVAVTAGTFSES